MKFKIDENLPAEIAEILRSAGHGALTVLDEGLGGKDDRHIIEVCLEEERTLITLDLDFADVRAYPPQEHHGLIVLRLQKQDKLSVIATFNRVIMLLGQEELHHRLWIVEENRIRVRGEDA